MSVSQAGDDAMTPRFPFNDLKMVSDGWIWNTNFKLERARR